MKIRVAIIGCGNIAGAYDENKKDAGVYSHAGAYRKFRDVELVAAMDVNPLRLKAFGKFWKVPFLYTNVTELLKNHDIDILSVCVPDKHHYSVVLQALKIKSPKVIFVEKPLAMSRKDVRTLLNLAKKNRTKVVLNSQRRWDVGHQFVRDAIRTGRIGAITAVTNYYVKGLYHIGCTAVNTMRFLVSEVDAVRAVATSDVSSLPGDPSVDAVLYLKNGAVATMKGVDRLGYRYSLFEIDILGTEGRFRLTDNGDRIEFFDVREYSHYSGFRELHPRKILRPSRMGDALTRGVGEIVDFLKNKKAMTQNDGEQGYRDLCVLDAISLSKQKGGALVSVPK